MARSSPLPGPVPRRPSGAKLLLAVSAVLVLGATVGLAGYLRFVAGGQSDPPAAGPAAPAARTTAPVPTAARRESRAPAPATLEVREAPVAEDRFLGAQEAGSVPPSSTEPAPAPPDPPRAIEPDRPAADDPHDFDLAPADMGEQR